MKLFLIFLALISATICFAQAQEEITEARTLLEFENDIQLEIIISTFDPSNHKIDTCYYESQAYICTIDDQPWFGSDMGLDVPRAELTKMTLIYQGNETELDVSGMFNPGYRLSIQKRFLSVQYYTTRIEVSGWFSDGAGTYCASWLVVKGTQIRTLLDSTDDACFAIGE